MEGNILTSTTTVFDFGVSPSCSKKALLPLLPATRPKPLLARKALRKKRSSQALMVCCPSSLERLQIRPRLPCNRGGSQSYLHRFRRRVSLTASNLNCSRTTTPVVPEWNLGYVVENDTGRVKLRKSADRLKGLETNLCCFDLAKLSPGVGAESGMVLIEARLPFSSRSSSSALDISWADSTSSSRTKTFGVESKALEGLCPEERQARFIEVRSGLPRVTTIERCSVPTP